MLRGFATINYRADDLDAAKRWYTELLGVMYNPHYLETLKSPGRT
jgi:catechol 2,3-dioxygenase-like lactoylglutathione lyase family enzyme